MGSAVELLTILSTSKAQLGPPGVFGYVGSAPGRVFSGKAEGELAGHLDVIQLIVRVPCSGERGRLRGEPEVGEDASHRFALDDDREDAKPSLAGRTFQHVDVKRAA